MKRIIASAGVILAVMAAAAPVQAHVASAHRGPTKPAPFRSNIQPKP